MRALASNQVPSNQTVAEVVADIFASAHSAPSPTEGQVYRKALVGVPDDVLKAAAARLIAAETWERGRRPSPAMVLEWVAIERAAHRARSAPPPLPPPVPPEVATEHMAAVRRARAAGVRASRQEHA